MPGGMGSTLVIRPKGLAALTMSLGTVGLYYVPLESLDFNEEQRWQFTYSAAPPGEGGTAVGEYGPLVPITLRVIINADTRAGVIEAYNDLQAALLNPKGGVIEYKPEDLGAGVLATFYHYVQSPPPRRMDRRNNRWDAPQVSRGKHVLFVDLLFHSQPVATSDPDSPETLSDLAATIQNWVDASPAQTNRVTVQAGNLKGSMPALLRILARPGSGQNLGRLIVFRRSEGTLANFSCIYEAEDSANIYPSVAWTTVADSARGDGNYLRCLPAGDANGVAQGRRFTIANPADHEGRFAVFGVGYDDAGSTGVWTHQAKVVCGNVVQEGESDWEAGALHSWGLIYVGEFELPPTPLSDAESGYDSGPYIEWYSTRVSGASEFRLDGLLLVYVSDSDLRPTALDVSCEDESGVTNSEKLLVENFPDDLGRILELTHVVAQSDGDFKRALMTAPRGDFLMLDPTVDNLLVFVQERALTTVLEDDFEGYKDSRWMLIGDFESDETWSAAVGLIGAETTYYIEGSQGRYSTNAAVHASIYKEENIDLENEGRFSSGDFVVIVLYLASKTNLDYVRMRFYESDGNYYQCIVQDTSLAVGYNCICKKKSDFTTIGSPSWDDITRQILDTFRDNTGGDDVTTRWDYWRIEKADPGDANNPNATGSQWNFQPVGGYWAITEDISGAGATLACLDIESGVEKSALIDETTPADVQFRARVRAKRDAGYTGILWRAGDDTLTEGAEDCYAALLDVANDKLLVREYAAGAITQHDDPAFTCAADIWYVVGVIAKGSTFEIYATAASNLTDDDDVFDADYLLATVSDSTLTSGKCGVMSISTLGRFDAVKLASLQDKVIPADEITLEGKAIWRTIAPFCE